MHWQEGGSKAGLGWGCGLVGAVLLCCVLFGFVLGSGVAGVVGLVRMV